MILFFQNILCNNFVPNGTFSPIAEPSQFLFDRCCFRRFKVEAAIGTGVFSSVFKCKDLKETLWQGDVRQLSQEYCNWHALERVFVS